MAQEMSRKEFDQYLNKLLSGESSVPNQNIRQRRVSKILSSWKFWLKTRKKQPHEVKELKISQGLPHRATPTKERQYQANVILGKTELPFVTFLSFPPYIKEEMIAYLDLIKDKTVIRALFDRSDYLFWVYEKTRGLKLISGGTEIFAEINKALMKNKTYEDPVSHRRFYHFLDDQKEWLSQYCFDHGINLT